MIIRPIGPDDNFDVISRIYAQSWKTAYRGLIADSYLDTLSEKSWTPFLKQYAGQLLLAEKQGALVGVTTYSAGRDAYLHGWGEIVSIYLLPEYFRQGIGSQLLQAALQQLENIGYDRVYLWVLAGNRRAKAFYERHGFRGSGEIRMDEIGGQPIREQRYIYHKAK